MMLYFDTEEYPASDVRKSMERIAGIGAEKQGLEASNLSLSISFVDAEEIRELNRQYRSVDEVTDVLSFPQWDGVSPLPQDREFDLGDVILCEEVVEQQAEQYGHSKERELLYLFTHGVLHLLGHDHICEEDKKAMRAQEEQIMEQMGLPRGDAKGWIDGQ